IQSDFRIDATFNNTSFGGLADFTGCNFLGFADFGGSQFAYNADFSNASFNGLVDFSRSTFSEKVNLHETQFKKNVYFESCKVNTLNLTGARYGWIFLHWDAINHLEFDDVAYQTLINNYKRLQWQTDLSDCRSAYLDMVQATPANNYSWILDTMKWIVARTNPNNLSSQE
ncbi:MAG: pentapeptide repeat-containing protein, partial [Methanothrix sp.]|nr:pentapeptide repeat-containing protein [Methanothrix sp.]